MTWKKFVVREKSDLREREKVSVREVVTSELSWIVQVVALLFLLWMQLLNGGKNGEKIVMVCRLWRKTIWLKQCCLCEHVVCWKLNFFEKVMRNMRDSVVSSVREKFRFLVTNDCVCGFRKKSWLRTVNSFWHMCAQVNSITSNKNASCKQKEIWCDWVCLWDPWVDMKMFGDVLVWDEWSHVREFWNLNVRDSTIQIRCFSSLFLFKLGNWLTLKNFCLKMNARDELIKWTMHRISVCVAVLGWFIHSQFRWSEAWNVQFNLH